MSTVTVHKAFLLFLFLRISHSDLSPLKIPLLRSVWPSYSIVSPCVLFCLAEPPSVPHAGDVVNQTVLAGFSTQLECEATGHPFPGNMAGITQTLFKKEFFFSPPSLSFSMD